jgi:choice-of-anchor B domain-containing protein
MHGTRTNGFRGAGALALLFASTMLGPALSAPQHDDPRFLQDIEPPYTGPGHTGTRVEPSGAGKVLDVFNASGVALLSWVPIPQFPGNSTRAASVWGYVSPSGREYAVIGLQNGTGFVEITDPLNPVIVGVVSGPPSIWREMKVYDHYAYSVHDRPDDDLPGVGVQVIDLAGMDQGTLTLVQNVQDLGLKTNHTISINPQSATLFVSGSGPNLNNGGIIAMSLVDPADPTFTSDTMWSEAYIHDQFVTTYTSGPYAGREISFAAGGTVALYIVDVTDKSNMFTISSIPYPGLGYCHHSWLSPDKKYLYVNDEFDELDNPGQTTTTHVVDVEDLLNPVYVGSFTNGNPAIDHNPMGRDGYLFEANYRSGLRIYDIRQIGQEHEVAYFDTYPNNDNPNFNGAWSVYALFPSRTIIISDIERGLFALEFTASDAPEWTRSLELDLMSYPNPARGAASFSYRLPSQGVVDLSLYDPAGRRVATLFAGSQGVGRHLLPWDPRATEAAAGVYFAVLKTPVGEARERVVLVR